MEIAKKQNKKSEIRNKQLKVQCEDCKSCFHATCIKMSKFDFKFHSSENRI